MFDFNITSNLHSYLALFVPKTLSICFFFFSCISLLFLAFSLVLASAAFLTFWAAYSMQQASATFSNWARSCCSSLCLLCISHYCSLSILVSFWEISERIREDMVIQKKRQKTFLFCLYIVDLGTIMGFFG